MYLLRACFTEMFSQL